MSYSMMYPKRLAEAQAFHASAKARAPKGTVSRQRRGRSKFASFNLLRVVMLGENWHL